MLKIRLQRVGRKNDPSFRVVVLESTEGPKSGNHVDEIGFYNAVTKQKSMDTEKARLWLSKGAQPSDTVYNMLVTEGVIDGKKRNVLPSKKPIIKEAPVAAEATAEEAPSETNEATEANEASEAVSEAPEMPAEASTQAGEAPAEVVTESPAETPAEEPTA
jgi:small subunit ribosomal protein S16